jgi:hypothetical protein
MFDGGSRAICASSRFAAGTGGMVREHQQQTLRIFVMPACLPHAR